MREEPNLGAALPAAFFLGACVAAIVSLVWAPPLISFTIVVVTFTAFATVALMSAKTTGGPRP